MNAWVAIVFGFVGLGAVRLAYVYCEAEIARRRFNRERMRFVAEMEHHQQIMDEVIREYRAKHAAEWRTWN